MDNKVTTLNTYNEIFSVIFDLDYNDKRILHSNDIRKNLKKYISNIAFVVKHKFQKDRDIENFRSIIVEETENRFYLCNSLIRESIRRDYPHLGMYTIDALLHVVQLFAHKFREPCVLEDGSKFFYDFFSFSDSYDKSNFKILNFKKEIEKRYSDYFGSNAENIEEIIILNLSGEKMENSEENFYNIDKSFNTTTIDSNDTIISLAINPENKENWFQKYVKYFYYTGGLIGFIYGFCKWILPYINKM